MTSEDNNEFSSVSSSIFYAIRNSSERQKLLLDSLSTQSTSITEKRETTSSNQVPIEVNEQELPPISINEVILKPRPLYAFYSGIPIIDKDKIPTIKKRKTETVEGSSTRQLLTTALQETKERLTSKRKKSKFEQETISKKELKNRVRKKIQDQTIRLNQFISEKKVVVKIKETNTKSQELNGVELNQESIFNDSDPFPFTNLSEWLIWHYNYPELAFVREAYDPEQIPDKGDIEVFWVNIMNDPEFFNPEWRIVGSNIDIDSIKQQKSPSWTPEWDIMSTYTDGFAIYFEDVYSLLSNYSQGLKNYRYPIIQFALKGLLLMDLVHFDNKIQKWFKKGTREDLSRLTKLDQFVSEQENLSTYRHNLNTEEMKNDWYIGLICFDLIITHSSFLKRFSQNQLLEDEKISILIEEDLNQIVSKKLSTIEDLEKVRVKNLRKKLEKG